MCIVVKSLYSGLTKSGQGDEAADSTDKYGTDSLGASAP